MGSNILKVLVYGFYDKGNLGDDFFKDAFKKLLPFEFKFVDKITKKDLLDYEYIIFGGGSFLYDKINHENCFSDILNKKIFYIGVGVENLHDEHKFLMSKAKFINTRSYDKVEYLKSINKNVMYSPDIVFCLTPKISDKKNTIAFITNGNLLPNHKSSLWEFNSWNYFKTEISQFCDEFGGVDFLPMSDDIYSSDINASIEIVNFTKNKKSKILKKPIDFYDFTYQLSSYHHVITQRFHGIVGCEIVQTNYTSISHHSKLLDCLPHNGNKLNYYGFNKSELIKSIKPCNFNFEFDFRDLTQKILESL